jgi:hypothetical protein
LKLSAEKCTSALKKLAKCAWKIAGKRSQIFSHASEKFYKSASQIGVNGKND